MVKLHNKTDAWSSQLNTFNSGAHHFHKASLVRNSNNSKYSLLIKKKQTNIVDVKDPDSRNTNCLSDRHLPNPRSVLATSSSLWSQQQFLFTHYTTLHLGSQSCGLLQVLWHCKVFPHVQSVPWSALSCAPASFWPPWRSWTTVCWWASTTWSGPSRRKWT